MALFEQFRHGPCSNKIAWKKPPPLLREAGDARRGSSGRGLPKRRYYTHGAQTVDFHPAQFRVEINTGTSSRKYQYRSVA